MASKAPSAGRSHQSRAKVIPAIPHALNSKPKSSRPRSQHESTPAPDNPPSAEPEEPARAPSPVTVDLPDNTQDTTSAIQESSVGDEASQYTLEDSNKTLDISQPEKASEPPNGIRQEETDQTPAASHSRPNIPSQSPIRELPPPFIPKNPSNTTVPAQQQDFRNNKANMHQPRLSTNSLVFGGPQESGSSSPVPPSGSGPVPFSPQTSTGYPGNMQMQGPPAFIPGGHSYHMSEPNAGPFYPPPFVHNPNFHGYPRDYYGQPPPQFGQSRPFYPPNPRFTYSGRRQDEFNATRRHPASHAQPNMAPAYMPGRPQEFVPDQARAGHPGNLPSPSPIVDGNLQTRPPQFNQPPQMRGGGSDSQGMPHRTSMSIPRPDYESAQSAEIDYAPLASFIHGQFGIHDFSDYTVHLSHMGYLFPPFSLACHGLVLARSPKLRSLMAMQNGGPNMQYPRTLQIQVSDRFLHNDVALTKALMRLYGEPLPDEASVGTVSPASPQPNQTMAARSDPMNFALAYAAAGHFLQHDEVVTRGLDLASRAIQWTNVETPLAFALEGGLGPNWNLGDTMAVEDRASTSSADETPAKLDSPTAAPQYGFYSDRLLRNVVQFLTGSWPESFKFVATAPQLAEVPRLPAIAEPKHSRSGSRLSHIRFGEMTVEDEGSKGDATSTKLSSILISLPFPVLKHVMEHAELTIKVGPSELAEVAGAVVEERESRRQRGTSARGSNHITESASEERLWHNIRWVESVGPDEFKPAGIKLSRRRVGVETPPSTGSGKS